MRAEDLHAWLVAQGTGGECDRFDVHILASILSIALIQAGEHGLPLSDVIGLGGREIVGLVGAMLPGALSRFETMADLPPPEADENQSMLRDLLRRGTSDGSEWQDGLAAMIARRAMEPHHLWQDLGLRHRRELSWLLERHFEPLARRNTGDMKWKKFFFRLICRDEGYRLCTTPVCDECDDFDACFGAEDGESLLAQRAAGRLSA
jgi:nitrogen fixation protein NifQ